jgi:hypothetical protein
LLSSFSSNLPLFFYSADWSVRLLCASASRKSSRKWSPAFLLGPSLFGLLWPDAQHWLFPWDPAQKMRDT